LKGLAGGQAVTVLGTVLTIDDPSHVEAEYLCGVDRQACLAGFSSSSTVTAVVVALALGE
jgi:hypothetical protein